MLLHQKARESGRMDIIAVLSILFHDLSFSMPVRLTYNEKKEKNGLCDLYEKGGDIHGETARQGGERGRALTGSRHQATKPLLP